MEATSHSVRLESPRQVAGARRQEARPGGEDGRGSLRGTCKQERHSACFDSGRCDSRCRGCTFPGGRELANRRGVEPLERSTMGLERKLGGRAPSRGRSWRCCGLPDSREGPHPSQLLRHAP